MGWIFRLVRNVMMVVCFSDDLGFCRVNTWIQSGVCSTVPSIGWISDWWRVDMME